MSNNGATAATHLNLVVSAPAKIISYPHFSTENISLSKVNDTLLEGYIPRFAQGDGSIVMINLTIAAKPNTHYGTSYQAYATYDQGSSKGVFSKPQLPVDIGNLLIGIVIILFYITAVAVYYKIRGRSLPSLKVGLSDSGRAREKARAAASEAADAGARKDQGSD